VRLNGNEPVVTSTEGRRGRLQVLFRDIARAVDEGRLEEALRLADCTCRIAPEDSTCLLVHSRLQIKLGAALEAAERLKARQDSEGMLARAEALCVLGLFDDAAAVYELLLRRFAADSVENLQQLATRLCRLERVGFPGWVGVDTKLRLVGQVRTGSQVTIQVRDSQLHPVVCQVDQDGFDSFACEVPSEASGQITVRAGESRLVGSDLSWPPEFGLFGWVLVENKALVGRVGLDWAPGNPVTLAITARGKDLRRVVVPSVGEPAGPLFSVPLDLVECDTSRLEISAVLPDGRYSALVGSPVAIQSICPMPVADRPKRTWRAQKENEPSSKGMIDIVIPVYAGRDETLSCLESVLTTTARDEVELVVVNDASPDSELCDALACLADGKHITLLTNQSNLGFPGAANRGMSLHPDRDVVLLNADTELFGDWLERLGFAAHCEDDIGTVTPLGEAASITSYPGKARRSHTKDEAAEIDCIARQVNARRVVELPVGVGYCLYIKRPCIAEAGGFDENTFGKGYGEESDFCLRARRMGWRHVAATDLFVRHRGARSYGRTKRSLMERNSRVLNGLHPGYDAMIAEFVAADPLLGARRSIDMHRLLKVANDPILLVTFDLPGGVKRHVDTRESELRAEGHTVLVLQPAGKDRRADQVILNAQDSGMENLVFSLPEELPILHALLLQLRLSNIELHHFAGLPPTVLDLVISLDVRYDVYVHDYSWVCPRLTLVGGNDVYCGEPPVEDCEACIRKHGTSLEESLTVGALRARSTRIMNGANAVTVPCDDVRTRLARYFPGTPMKVSGWEMPIQPVFRLAAKVAGRIRVAVIGAISISKGYRVLLQCARDAADRALDLEFVLIGFAEDDEALLATGRVFITGPYAENEVAALLEREKCHVAFFPSVVPETWCYALTYALSRGLPIIAFDLGAIAERLRSYVGADLLPLSASTALTNDTLLRSARRTVTSQSKKEPAMDPTPTTTNQNASDELAASVQILTLPAGTYTFTVKAGGPAGTVTDGLTMPALQVGLAPKQAAGDVEFLAREGTSDRWLARSSDMIVAKIFSEAASLMLTSVRLPNSPALAIDVRRLGDEPFPASLETAPAEAADGLPTRIIAHIQNLGDIPFSDGLVGCIGGGLWIEAFSIVSVGQLAPDSVEYCAVTADGFQTPWLANQALCGSRGRGTPIVGFAIRLKPEIAAQYDCVYTGKFVSGNAIGPFRNGDLCSSDAPGDPLWGIELRVTPRAVSESKGPHPETQYSTVA
jgi:GT2 family glycosyltransferase/glycosyltransferase involved in cell wall biosynthesis